MIGAIILTCLTVSGVWWLVLRLVNRRNNRKQWTARDIFSAHYSLVLKPEQDAAPKNHIEINCITCGISVRCPIRTVIGISGAKQTVKVDVDATNLEAHELSHSLKDRKAE